MMKQYLCFGMILTLTAGVSARSLKGDFIARLLRGDHLACKGGVTPDECLAIDPHPQCTPFRSVDYCAPDESFQTYITTRSRFVRDFPEGSHWFHHLENKLAGYKVSAALGLNPPKIYSCSNEILHLDQGFTPPGDEVGFVIRATDQHSSKGVYVLPHGLPGREYNLGIDMTAADVIADMMALGVTRYIIEEYVSGKGTKIFPMEYKLHMIGGEVASINVVANRGESCACWAEMDVDQNRLDQYGCFTPAGNEEKNGQCTAIDFQTGRNKAHPMKGMDICSALPAIDECVMNDMIALATKASEAIGVYVRVDMFVGPNDEIYVQEFSTNHMNGLRHCSAIKDENGCIDPCFQGRMWKNTGSSTFGGTETDMPTELQNWLKLSGDEACTDVEANTPINATPESSCPNTAAPIPRAPPTPVIVTTSEPSAVPSLAGSAAPSMTKSRFPSKYPSLIPSAAPSLSPSGAPSVRPSGSPSNAPSVVLRSQIPFPSPSGKPSKIASHTPSSEPSGLPSGKPSSTPSSDPSAAPSFGPSSSPSVAHSSAPSKAPSGAPSGKPSNSPSNAPSVLRSDVPSPEPSADPTKVASSTPSAAPSTMTSANPSTAPSKSPSSEPSITPSTSPSSVPSTRPSFEPSKSPSTGPTITDSKVPSFSPSGAPSSAPSSEPSSQPSSEPSNHPSTSPSAGPTETPNIPPKVSTNGNEETVAQVASTVKNPSFEIGFTFTNNFKIKGAGAVLGWETTSFDNMVEIWHKGFQRGTGIHEHGRDPDDGDYFVELNANEPAALWQEVDTRGVAALTIDFAHGQRSKDTEQISVWVGASMPPKKTNKTDVLNWRDLGFTRVIETSSDSVVGWHQYQAAIDIPLGQNKTYVVFESLDGLARGGNFLDDVKLSGANSVSLDAFDISLSDVDDDNLEEATITLTNADITSDTLGLGGLLPAGMTSATTVADGKIELRIMGSASKAEYQSIVNGVGFASYSNTLETRVIEITVNDGEDDSNTETVKIRYIILTVDV